jgi:hypothetical protein
VDNGGGRDGHLQHHDAVRSVPDLPAVFTLADLRRRGVTKDQADYRVTRGVWHRLRQGVYCSTHLWRRADAEQRHVLTGTAMVLAAEGHGPLALSHTTAAVVHGLPVPVRALRTVTLTSGPGTKRTTSADRHVYFAGLPDADLVMHCGVPVTSPARTAADCLRHLPMRDAVAVADAALHGRATTFDQVRAVLAGQAGWPFAGVAALALRLVDGRRESALESRSAVVMATHGIPAPRPQCRVLDARGVLVARVDFGWPELGVVGEADGRTKYAGDAARVVEAEKERQAQLEALGLVVVRWGERHLHGPEPVLVVRLNDAFARADGRRFVGRAA